MLKINSKKSNIKKQTTSVTEIVDEKFNINCSTKTFVAKIYNNENNNIKVTIDELLKQFPGSYKTKFRNCIVKKIEKKSIKIYTNFTLQVNGFSTEQELLDLMNSLNLKKNYQIECVMSNWTIKISEREIDLKKTMENLNNNGITAYFLRGYPLIIKYNKKELRNSFLLLFSEDKYVLTNNKSEFHLDTEISVLMFKSGNCIVSGRVEKICVECILKLKSHLSFI